VSNVFAQAGLDHDLPTYSHPLNWDYSVYHHC
jgi:hypothetical protein